MRGGHARAAGRGVPRRGLVGEDREPGLRHAEGPQHPADVAARVGAGRDRPATAIGSAAPVGRASGAASTTRRARKTGSLTSPGPPDRSGPSATSASRCATSALISAVADTPADTSIDPPDRAVNASASGPVTNSTSGLGATSRSRSAAPWAMRTADSASAPSDTICAAIVSSRAPARGQLHAVRAPGEERVVEVAAQRGDGLRHRGFADPERRRRRLDGAEPCHEDECAELGQRHWIILRRASGLREGLFGDCRAAHRGQRWRHGGRAGRGGGSARHLDRARSRRRRAGRDRVGHGEGLPQAAERRRTRRRRAAHGVAGAAGAGGQAGRTRRSPSSSPIGTAPRRRDRGPEPRGRRAHPAAARRRVPRRPRAGHRRARGARARPPDPARGRGRASARPRSPRCSPRCSAAA